MSMGQPASSIHFPLVLDLRNQYLIGVGTVAVLGEVSGSSAIDHELASINLDRPSDERMLGENLQALENQGCCL
jgi:hypothetical protein